MTNKPYEQSAPVWFRRIFSVVAWGGIGAILYQLINYPLDRWIWTIPLIIAVGYLIMVLAVWLGLLLGIWMWLEPKDHHPQPRNPDEFIYPTDYTTHPYDCNHDDYHVDSCGPHCPDCGLYMPCE